MLGFFWFMAKVGLELISAEKDDYYSLQVALRC